MWEKFDSNVPVWVGSNEGYLLLQGVAYSTGITKLHEIIVDTFFCFCVCFFLYVSKTVKGIQLELTLNTI